MKYIIEIAKEYEEYFKGILICGIADGKFAVDVIAREDLEELTSDYINEHFGDLQDTAYQRGLEDGKQTAIGAAELREKLEYQKGLDDAWEVATRIVCDETLGMSTLLHIFNRGTLERIFKDIPPAEAIAKLKAYEEKQKTDDEIKVGDEVIYAKDDVYVVTYICGENCDGINPSTGICREGMLLTSAKKTGRHFGIELILKEMRESI